ncbi:MAG: hypothetical protein O2906_01220 [Bacteroidetes bacterium]|nr:hypothetical protein [Bacteroidota bacterium]MDA0859580.1 hypothetical protein [Bacteroidota bacterium]MDA1317834.1 hypothetical protein [Bacteroidota bacterium]
MKNRINTFKLNWEISKNWQLLYPFLGMIISFFLGYRFAIKIFRYNFWLQHLMTVVLGFSILQLCVFFIKKLQHKWVVNARWELIRIFIVFGITGSSSVFVGRPIIKLLGVSIENLGPVLYWVIFCVVSLIFYQILLVFCGWLFGQFEFFWDFEKKMLKRLGFSRFLEK